MTERELKQCLELAAQLWPGRFEVNHEQANVWMIALRQYSVGEVIGALRDHAAYSKYVPKPAEIRDRCEQHNDREVRNENYVMSAAERAALESRIEQDRIEVDSICDAMGDEEFNRHCVSAERADWRLEWLRKSDRWNSKIGRSIVATRVESGLGPDDDAPLSPVPNRIPEEKRAKQNRSMFTSMVR